MSTRSNACGSKKGASSAQYQPFAAASDCRHDVALSGDDVPSAHHVESNAQTWPVGPTTHEDVRAYLAELTSQFVAQPPGVAKRFDPPSLGHQIFSVLTHRQFSHLSRSRT